jgi:hypothetical protein
MPCSYGPEWHRSARVLLQSNLIGTWLAVVLSIYESAELDTMNIVDISISWTFHMSSALYNEND